MNSPKELNVQAYLDNELTPGEARQVANLLNSDPEAREVYRVLKETKAIVRENEPELRLQEPHDFYWSRIRREIERSEREPAQAVRAPLWMRLMAPIAGAVALFAVLLSISGPQVANEPVVQASNSAAVQEEFAGPMHEGEVVVPDMTAITFRSEREGMTVVWVSSTASLSAPEPQPFDWLD
jgi:anti-sigma factor RsiW